MSAVGLQTERLVLGQADRPDTTTLRTFLSDQVQEIGQPPAVPESSIK